MRRKRWSSWRSATRVEAVAQDEGAPTPRTLGQTLAAERERQGLSRADVAQRLHMSAYQVEALENGDYKRLPQGTFLRGFVRNYAKALGLPADDLLTLLSNGAAPVKRPIVVPDESIRFDPAGQGVRNPFVQAASIAFVVIALALAAMYWWLFVRPAPPASSSSHKPVVATPAITPAPVEAPVKPTVVAPAPVAATPVTATPAPPPAAASAPVKSAAPPAPAPAVTPTAAPASSEPTLKFVFKGQSWVEVRDAKGRLLLSRLNPPGSDAEVTGKPPFNVIVGNAPEVQVYYKDHEFDLEPHTKVAVARFTVE